MTWSADLSTAAQDMFTLAAVRITYGGTEISALERRGQDLSAIAGLEAVADLLVLEVLASDVPTVEKDVAVLVGDEEWTTVRLLESSGPTNRLLLRKRQAPRVRKHL